ncbi:MAG: 3-isopropylmalate dehydratase small subunit [Acidobacteria bacterium]|nr:3-isopropylmalate dehydratase small subunit [Acidobacteriota bacterium]
MSQASKITRVVGPAVAVRGDDIDTDRIIPARYLKTITFDGLGDHVFEDDRQQLRERGAVHPFDVPAHRGAAILLVQENFGCGSSREHAPQAIARWGIHAIVGESFAEIFFGNALMMGLPCATASRADLDRLMAASEANPALEFDLDLERSQLTAGDIAVPVTMPEAVRTSLLTGNWDATGLLLDRYEEVERVAAKLPYVSGWNVV